MASSVAWSVFGNVDAAEIPLEDDAADLVFCSPPYEARRRYAELDFRLKGGDWVAWCVDRYVECLRVCRGLVAWVVDGGTERHRYSCGPELLIAELHRRGVCLRRPCYYLRHGIPGSGGRDWLKGRAEVIVCATRERGPLPWADPTACGHAPKYGPGGPTSSRAPSGARQGAAGRRRHYRNPARVNPGNVIDCGAAGGGNIGHELAHENEAPFPLGLAAFFVRSFCPPGGLVVDPFCGSGTTGHAALEHGRRFIGFDLRDSQRELAARRLRDVGDKLRESARGAK